MKFRKKATNTMLNYKNSVKVQIVTNKYFSNVETKRFICEFLTNKKKYEIQHSTAIVINKSTKYVLHSMKYKLKCYVGKSVIHKNSLDGWKL